MPPKINILSSTEQAPQVTQPVVQPVNRKSMPSHIVGPEHLRANYFMVKVGLAAGRPTTSNEVRFYFATDTKIMSYFDPDTKTWTSGSAFS